MTVGKGEMQTVTSYPGLTLDTAWHGNSYGNTEIVYIGEGAARKKLCRPTRTIGHRGTRAHSLSQVSGLITRGADVFDVSAINKTLHEQSKVVSYLDAMVQDETITSAGARPIFEAAEKLSGQLRIVRTARVLREANFLREFVEKKEGGLWAQVYSEDYHLSPEQIGDQDGLVRSRILQLAGIHIEAPEDEAADALPVTTALFRDEHGTVGTFTPQDPIDLFLGS
jgi:hypothetical protein